MIMASGIVTALWMVRAANMRVLVLLRRIQVNEQRECYVIYVSHNFASAAIKDDAVGVLGKANIKHIFLSENI